MRQTQGLHSHYIRQVTWGMRPDDSIKMLYFWCPNLYMNNNEIFLFIISNEILTLLKKVRGFCKYIQVCDIALKELIS